MNEQDERMKLLIALQPKFREAMGEDWLPGDWGFRKEWGLVCYQEGIGSMEGFIRLPLPIDPRNPGRGLTGMIKNFAGIDLDYRGWRVMTQEPGNFIYNEVSHGKTIELALLKALVHQEGVEVK